MATDSGADSNYSITNMDTLLEMLTTIVHDLVQI